MAKVLTDPQNYQNIANAIRGKNGSSSTYSPSQMASAITNLPTGGDTLAQAFDGTLQSYTYSGNKTSVGQYEGNVFRGDTINLPTITSVSQYAFASNNGVRVLNIPNLQITSNSATGVFNYCSALESITIKKLGGTAQSQFEGCTSLVTVTVTNGISRIGKNCFLGCSALVNIDMSTADLVSENSFKNCSSLQELHFDGLKTSSYFVKCVDGCTSLKTVDIGKSQQTGYGTTFGQLASSTGNLTSFDTLIIRKTDAISALNQTPTNAFSSASPLVNGNGYVYVPSALKSTYEGASNWSTLVGQFRALEDYTVDETTTGNLDPTKI